MPPDTDEAELLRAARRGDPEAFARLYQLHAKAIHSLVLRLSGTGTEGATIRLYLERYEPAGGNLDGDTTAMLTDLAAAAEALAGIARLTGRKAPDVIT